MRNADAWLPSKFLPTGIGAWRVNPEYVAPGSWFFCNRVIGTYQAAIEQHAHGRLLDAGCGDVPYYGIYRQHVTSVTCIDWPGSSHGRQHIDEWVDLNGKLPFGDDTFDTVLLTDVLEHILQPARLLGEAARVLAQGGTLIVAVPFLYWVHEAPHDYFRYTAHALSAMCRDVGLVELQLDAYGGYPDVLLDLVSKGLVRGQVSGRLFTGVSGRVARLAAYRRLAERTSVAFPLGYVMAANKT